MRKSVAFKRPVAPTDPDTWIEGGKEIEPEPPKRMVRFTLDVDADLHMRMKLECVRQGKAMADVLRAVLAREFPPTVEQ